MPSATGALSKTENLELYKALMAGDVCARNKLIEGNMALVVFLVDAILESLPHAAYLRDDLISEGWLQLVIKVDSFPKKKRLKAQNLTGYLGKAISQKLRDYLDQENVIRVPDRTKRRGRAEGDAIPMPVSVLLDEAATRGQNDPELALVELRDQIESCCEKPIERELIRHAAKGFTNKQLAEILGLPLSTTNRIRREIYARFLAKSGMPAKPRHRRKKKRCTRSKESA